MLSVHSLFLKDNRNLAIMQNSRPKFNLQQKISIFVVWPRTSSQRFSGVNIYNHDLRKLEEVGIYPSDVR